MKDNGGIIHLSMKPHLSGHWVINYTDDKYLIDTKLGKSNMPSVAFLIPGSASGANEKILDFFFMSGSKKK